MKRNILLNKFRFEGSEKQADITFKKGINVVCGASDTGKSFIAETIDYMFGGKAIRQITELEKYEKIFCELCIAGEDWILKRGISGKSFTAIYNNKEETLQGKHSANNEQNISTFFLDKIDLKDKKIRKNQNNGTVSFTFRDVSRIIIVQEGEIHKNISPFITGQHTHKTVNFSAIKLLLTGKDDSSLVEIKKREKAFNYHPIEEIVNDLEKKLDGSSLNELTEQFNKLEENITEQENSLKTSKASLSDYSKQREAQFKKKTQIEDRISEIESLLSRFDLLSEHYRIDITRLEALEESAHLFQHTEQVDCPSCGAKPNNQISHHESNCIQDFTSIIQAAKAEISKIRLLSKDLDSSKSDLKSESSEIKNLLKSTNDKYRKLEEFIQETLSPSILSSQTEYSQLVKLRYEVEGKIDNHEQLEKLKRLLAVSPNANKTKEQEADIAPNAFDELSKMIANILEKWGIYSTCEVQFDLDSKDFLINTKPRGNSGKGLRALTHSAVTIALLEYCQDKKLPHPGLIVLDSPLLAFYEADDPDGDNLKENNVKNKFYQYLKKHHSENQIIIIENEKPLIEGINVVYFSGNSKTGRSGLL